jgi:hypothetical protein
MAQEPGTGRAAEDELRAMREHERDKRIIEASTEAANTGGSTDGVRSREGSDA